MGESTSKRRDSPAALLARRKWAGVTAAERAAAARNAARSRWLRDGRGVVSLLDQWLEQSWSVEDERWPELQRELDSNRLSRRRRFR